MGGPPPTNYYQFVVLCLDRKTGKTLWQQTACERAARSGPRNGQLCLRVADHRRQARLLLFRIAGHLCYDMDGKLEWQKTDLGQMKIKMGFGEGRFPGLVRRYLHHQLGS